MFIGDGAKLVRDAFELAKEKCKDQNKVSSTHAGGYHRFSYLVSEQGTNPATTAAEHPAHLHSCNLHSVNVWCLESICFTKLLL